MPRWPQVEGRIPGAQINIMTHDETLYPLRKLEVIVAMLHPLSPNGEIAENHGCRIARGVLTNEQNGIQGLTTFLDRRS